MTKYRVTWMIDVDARTALSAARKARAAQTRRGTTARVFYVHNEDQPNGSTTIDLDAIDLAKARDLDEAWRSHHAPRSGA